MKVTFEELRQQVALYAAAMRKMGVSKGDRVVGECFRQLLDEVTRSLVGRQLRTQAKSGQEGRSLQVRPSRPPCGPLSGSEASGPPGVTRPVSAASAAGDQCVGLDQEPPLPGPRVPSSSEDVAGTELGGS